MRIWSIAFLVVFIASTQLDAQTRHTRRRESRPNGKRQAATKVLRSRGGAGSALSGATSAAKLRNGKRLSQKRVLPQASTLNKRRAATAVPAPPIRRGRALTGSEIELQRRLQSIERLKFYAAGANNDELLKRLLALEQLARGYQTGQEQETTIR